ncbi:RidA family protein [Acetobacteraceae bacterium]|nr:RidA family protein [Acetobacteraceae bacterium]
MMSNPEEKLAALNITLPTPAKSVANYLPFKQAGDLIFISGQLPLQDRKLPFTGKVGKEVSLENAKKAAELCFINILAQFKESVKGDLSALEEIVQIQGFVAAESAFYDHAQIINGASDLAVDIFGEKGRHSRFAVGVSSLPLNTPVEISAIIRVRL